VAFTYDTSLVDAQSRVRYAVGDISTPGLFPDATYGAQISATTARRVSLSATADDDTFTAAEHGYVDGDAVALITLFEEIGPVVGTTYFIRDATADTFALAATRGGVAIDVTADGAGTIGVVDEAAAIREIARGLAARYATKPSQVRLVSGLSVTWERVQQWNKIALGEAGGASAGRAKGFTLRRGPAVDYTTGEGDADA
jgi:hypothetical protein